MTWEQIRDLYLKATGNAQDAIAERWDHINFAYRQLCGALELPELHQPNAIVTTVDGQDWVDLDCDVFSLDWIVNKTTGRKLDPEPGGHRGRARYFEQGQTRPPEGTVNFYVRRGTRVWLRDTPDAAIDLIASFRFHPPETADADVSEHPITPPQYDMALLKLAAGNYYSLHPPLNPVDGSIDVTRGQLLISGAETEIQRLRSPVAEEQMDRRDFVRQPGYSFNVR